MIDVLPENAESQRAADGALEPFETPVGVIASSSVWIVTARAAG